MARRIPLHHLRFTSTLCKLLCVSAVLVLSVVSNILVSVSLETCLSRKLMPQLSPYAQWKLQPVESTALFHPHCQAPLEKVEDTENHCTTGCSWLHGTPRFCCCKRESEYEWDPTHGEHIALQTILKAIKKKEKLKPRQRGVIWCCFQLSHDSLCHRAKVFWTRAACVSTIAVWASPLPLWRHWTLSEALPLALGGGVQSHTPNLHSLPGFSSLQVPDTGWWSN